MSALLRVDGLSVRYADGTEAVRDVSFTIAPGEVFGLVGESGSGKSSVCAALLGLLPHGARRDARSITFDGGELTGLTEKQLQAVRGHRIAYVPQQPMTALAPTAPVVKQLRWYLGAKLDDPETRSLLHDIGLGPVLDRPRDLPGKFSGGQLQRVVIAIAALSHEPTLLLADEPTTALDPTVQEEVLKLLLDLRERLGLAVLYVSHDLGVVARVCDRVGVMTGGSLVETAPVRELFDAPAHPYTKGLLAAAEPAGPRAAEKRTDVVLSARDLVKDFAVGTWRTKKVVHAVDKVTLDVAAGQVLAIVGESGSGKTTVARMLAGILTPTSGEVLWKGEPLPAVRPKEQQRHIQLVTQNPRAAFNRRRTLRHALRQPLRVHGLAYSDFERDGLVDETVRKVGLTKEHLDRLPRDLSGGELARMVLARALLVQPGALVLDEPTASLDASVKSTVLDLLAELRDAYGLAVVLITHEIDVARRLADTVAVMYGGRVVEAGPADEVLVSPAHSYTRTLLESAQAAAVLRN